MLHSFWDFLISYVKTPAFLKSKDAKSGNFLKSTVDWINGSKPP